MLLTQIIDNKILILRKGGLQMKKSILVLGCLLMSMNTMTCQAEDLENAYDMAIEVVREIYTDEVDEFELKEVLFLDISENNIIPFSEDDKYAIFLDYAVDGDSETRVLVYDENEEKIELEGNMNDMVMELYQKYFEDTDNTIHSLDIFYIGDCIEESVATEQNEEETRWLSSDQVFPEDNWEYYPLNDKNIDAKIPTMDSIIKAVAENAMCDEEDGSYVYFWSGDDGYTRGNSMGSFLTYTSVLEELGFELTIIDPSLMGGTCLETYEIGYESQPLAIVAFASVDGAGSGTLVALLE